jgi:hypothetical protein
MVHFCICFVPFVLAVAVLVTPENQIYPYLGFSLWCHAEPSELSIHVGTAITVEVCVSLCEGYPGEFVIYLNYVRKVRFEEVVDYDFLRDHIDLFTKVLKIQGEVEERSRRVCSIGCCRIRARLGDEQWWQWQCYGTHSCW